MGEGGLVEGRRLIARAQVLDQARPRDHRTIVDAVAIVHCADSATTLVRHDCHHLLKAKVAADTADQKHLVAATVGHRSLGHLDQHRENSLLQRVAQVFDAVWTLVLHSRLLLGLFTADELLDECQQARKTHIHTFYDIGKLNVVGAFLSALFYVEAGTRIVAQADDSGKAVQTVPDCDVNRLSKDAVAFLAVSENLRVSTRDIKDSRV